mmetsp:Transcript_9191/g.20475  ORF Transcript_9191/g.20475 Transcript_9191/m.20475 type:complete len:279 (+) Transcript_9191:478-1314(+)
MRCMALLWHELAYAKICHLKILVRCQEQIQRLQVAMDDRVCGVVQERQCSGNTTCPLHKSHPGWPVWVTCLGRLFHVEPLQITTLHKLGHEERGRVIQTSTQEHHEVWVTHMRQQANLVKHFALKKPESLGVRAATLILCMGGSHQVQSICALGLGSDCFDHHSGAPPIGSVDDAFDRLTQHVSDHNLLSLDSPVLQLRVEPESSSIHSLGCAFLLEDGTNISVAVFLCLRERGVAKVVMCIDIRPVLNQPIEDVFVPICSSNMQRSPSVVVGSVCLC